MAIHYQIADNEFNLTYKPWDGAIGIEEIDSNNQVAVPPLVCWLTRGENQENLAHRIVALLNGVKA